MTRYGLHRARHRGKRSLLVQALLAWSCVGCAQTDARVLVHGLQVGSHADRREAASDLRSRDPAIVVPILREALEQSSNDEDLLFTLGVLLDFGPDARDATAATLAVLERSAKDPETKNGTNTLLAAKVLAAIGQPSVAPIAHALSETDDADVAEMLCFCVLSMDAEVDLTPIEQVVRARAESPRDDVGAAIGGMLGSKLGGPAPGLLRMPIEPRR